MESRAAPRSGFSSRSISKTPRSGCQRSRTLSASARSQPTRTSNSASFKVSSIGQRPAPDRDDECAACLVRMRFHELMPRRGSNSRLDKCPSYALDELTAAAALECRIRRLRFHAEGRPPVYPYLAPPPFVGGGSRLGWGASFPGSTMAAKRVAVITERHPRRGRLNRSRPRPHGRRAGTDPHCPESEWRGCPPEPAGASLAGAWMGEVQGSRSGRVRVRVRPGAWSVGHSRLGPVAGIGWR